MCKNMEPTVSWEGESVPIRYLSRGPGYDTPEARRLRETEGGDVVKLPLPTSRLPLVANDEKK